jgi:hypothetical protein
MPCPATLKAAFRPSSSMARSDEMSVVVSSHSGDGGRMIAKTAGSEAAIFRRACKLRLEGVVSTPEGLALTAWAAARPGQDEEAGHAGGDTSEVDENRTDGGALELRPTGMKRGRAPKAIQHPAATNAQDASVARLTAAGTTAALPIDVYDAPSTFDGNGSYEADFLYVVCRRA